MVAVLVTGVDAIDNIGVTPAFHVGDVLVLRPVRPIVKTRVMPGVRALHFLQQHDVGVKVVEPVTHLVDHHLAVQRRQPLVDVVGRNGDGRAHGSQTAVGICCGTRGQ